MEVISCSRMSNQRRILLEDHSTGQRVWKKAKRREIFRNTCSTRKKGSKNDIPNYPSSLAKLAGQPNKHLVHLRPPRASCTSKTFTKYPLTTHSLLFVSAVLFISLFSQSPSLVRITLVVFLSLSMNLMFTLKSTVNVSSNKCFAAGYSSSSVP